MFNSNPNVKCLESNDLQLINFMEEGVRLEKFTSWSVGNGHTVLSSYFVDEYCPKETTNHLHPIFDLSSLTKPLFGLASFFINFREDLKNSYQTRVSEFLETPLHLSTSFQRILNHQFYLKPWVWMGKAKFLAAEFYLGLISLLEKETAIENNTNVYSDLNYILMAIIFNFNKEKLLKGSKLDFLHQLNESCGTNYGHIGFSRHRTVPFFPYLVTYEEFQGDNFGEVNDTNANILNEQKIWSFHAGLQGTVCDIIKSVDFLINHLHSLPANSGRFFKGLDTASSPESLAAPPTWPSSVLGHLGYSGCSFWFDAETQKRQVILTNRTARRTSLYSHSNERILVVTKNGQEKFFLNKDGKKFELLKPDEARAILEENSKSTQVLWNKDKLCVAADINPERKRAGKLLW